MTTITTTAVSPSTLIESSWGNAVRTDLINLNADKLELAGGTMTGHISGITPTSPAHLTRKDYVDGVVAGLLSASGGTVTGGSITIATSGEGVILPAGEPSGNARAARKDYVDTQVATRLALTGGTVTGSITLSTSGQGVNLPTGEPSGNARAARKDYVDNAVNGRVATTGDTMTGLLTASAGVVLGTSPSGTYAARKDYVDSQIGTRMATSGGTFSGPIAVNSDDPINVTSGGSFLAQAAGRVFSAVDDVNVQNFYARRYGAGGAINNGQRFFTCVRSSTEIGSITIASSTSVAFNTTSDPRLKVRTGDAADATPIVQQLGSKAFRGFWQADEERTPWLMISSHDVEDVAPYLVLGERDAVDADGGIVPQQVNWQGAVPAILAALSQALDRIDALEAALT